MLNQLNNYINFAKEKRIFNKSLSSQYFLNLSDFINYFAHDVSRIKEFKSNPKNLADMAMYFINHVSPSETPAFISFLEVNNINVIDSSGNNLVIKFCDYHEDFNYMDDEGTSPFAMSASPKIYYKKVRYLAFPKKLELLLASPLFPIDYQNTSGQTALMFLIANKNYKCASMLLDLGASPLCLTRQGETALSIFEGDKLPSTHVAGVEVYPGRKAFEEKLKTVIQKQSLEKALNHNSETSKVKNKI